MHLKRAKDQVNSSFDHFGMKDSRAIGSWIMRFDAQVGTRKALKMLFLRNNKGKIEMVGSKNGNIAVRYVHDGRPPNLIVWNPTTSRVSRIDDPMMHVGSFGICAYVFVYIPDTLDYVWLYIYKKSIIDQNCWINTYSNVDDQWGRETICQPFVQILDPKYVVINGVVYWINWNNQGLYRCLLWKIEEVDGNRSWRLWIDYRGVGSAEYPECFSGGDLITV
ncbi:hypothetical protein PIB30_078948 [Stylosanthes scabra]|uniref:F-box associated domain-containing protein n=1 Tax=Stylosanthes scabra TaxID=79078 RepID=A0ABU6VPG0_9FABA|nr:hypothetical protein [Stylosanthes scabra]